MASPSLVDQVRDLSRELRQVAALLPNDDPLQPPNGKKNAPSFLFEVRVLLALLRGLTRSGWRITVERRAGQVRLVRGPARKIRGSFFRVTRAETMFQLTQGTQVQDRHGEPRAPDICLQRGEAGDEPSFQDVLALWDAKLRGTSGKVTDEPVSDDALRSFAMIRAWLAPPHPGEDPLSGWPDAFTVCAIVSNGRKPTEPVGVLIEAGVSIVEKFGDENTPAWPSRQEHITARASLSAPTE